MRESTHTHTFLLYNKQLESAKKKNKYKDAKVAVDGRQNADTLANTKEKKEKMESCLHLREDVCFLKSATKI